MKIQLVTRMAGPEGNFPPGTILELDEKQAKPLIDGGYAVRLDIRKVAKK